ncbi:MAG TPA: SfiI family type II restriction endonuclease [Solirubrobacteraceae bacterium]|jgi:hypothetical protein|nr:SfiI family type II restriction endonuclease [Solirubrobacteraceae bacterium]
MLTEPASLTLPEIEEIEKQTLRWVVQAILDYAPSEIWDEFRNSPDNADGVAEDVTQECLSRLSGYTLDKRRLYGTVDYRRARYAILPELIVCQALFVDSKAEQSGGSGRIQINQSSLKVLFAKPDGSVIRVPGGLTETVELADATTYLTTTVFVHYHYAESASAKRTLKQIQVVALPNGRLETDYVVSPTETIWNVGPDSPARGEAQRARIAFAKLKARASWRVQSIRFASDGRATFTWDS